jgi:hypothetical protein
VHLTESLDISGSSVCQAVEAPPRGPSDELSEELAAGVSQPRWIRVAPSVHPGSSFLPHVRLTPSAAKRGRQDADGPRFIRLDSEFRTLMAVSGLAASYSSGMRMSVSGPWGAQKSRAALRSSSLGFQVSATDNTPSSNRIRRSPLQLAASGHPSKDTRACSEKLTVFAPSKSGGTL